MFVDEEFLGWQIEGMLVNVDGKHGRLSGCSRYLMLVEFLCCLKQKFVWSGKAFVDVVKYLFRYG